MYLLVNSHTGGLGESSNLAPQIQQFAVQCVALLRGLASDFFDPKTELPLPNHGRDSQDRSG